MTRRWRPSLPLVLGGALAGTLGLSLLGMIALRYLGPEIGFRRAALGLAMLIAVATGGLGWLLVRVLLRPIRDLEAFAAAQEQGRQTPPPRHFGTKELHATGQAIIAMAEALRSRETAIRAFSDHVTHELRTPAAAIRAGVELLEDSSGLSDGDRAILTQIDSARQQLETQLSALRSAAQSRETRHLGQSTLAMVDPGLRAEWPGLDLQITGGDIAIPIAPDGLRIVLGHLLRNAAENGAMEVRLRAFVTDGCASLTVQDDGRGISAGNAARVFDAFFTTRRETGGTGMGLTVVRAVLEAHHARIALQDSAQGAFFTMDFPPASRMAGAGQSQRQVADR